MGETEHALDSHIRAKVAAGHALNPAEFARWAYLKRIAEAQEEMRAARRNMVCVMRELVANSTPAEIAALRVRFKDIAPMLAVIDEHEGKS